MSRNSLITRTGLAAQAQSLSNLMKDAKYGSAAEIMSMPSAKLVAILQDQDSSVYARAKACQRLAVVGDHNAVPALVPLLTDPRLSHYARFALEPMPDPSASDALRGALGMVQGGLLVGIINSIGARRDTRSIAVLEKLRHDNDIAVSLAADSAMARIRPPL